MWELKNFSYKPLKIVPVVERTGESPKVAEKLPEVCSALK